MSKETRRIDGKPETESDRRFFDLRESGYKGWINQDGYASDDKGRRIDPKDGKR